MRSMRRGTIGRAMRIRKRRTRKRRTRKRNTKRIMTENSEKSEFFQHS